jgi:malonate decarboxylase alpha subunit
MVESFGDKMAPVFVEELDCVALADELKLDLVPIMIRGDDVTHIVTAEGIANLLLCRTAGEREQAIRGVAGYTDVGRGRDKAMVARLRERRAILYPEDLGIDVLEAQRHLLAARSIKDLVRWSEGLYQPPGKFRNW